MGEHIDKISISEGEWKIMDLLWKEPPKTLTQLTKELSAETGWTKHTIITMLKRLEAKRAVYHEDGEKAKLFYPAISRTEIEMEETKGFLNRVYDGSISMMLHSMVSAKKLSKQDIDELYAILKEAEEDNK